MGIATSTARGIATAGDRRPPARYEHAAFLGYRHHRPYMFIFGGSSTDGQLLNDLWQLDLMTFQFEECSVRGSPPSPRTLHQGGCCLRNRQKSCDRFYVWSGGAMHHAPVDANGSPMYVLDIGGLIMRRRILNKS